MIRKDVVLGMSIGGVLLALVVVYVAIEKSARSKGPGVDIGIAQSEVGGLPSDPQPSPAADSPKPIANDIPHPTAVLPVAPGKATASPKRDDSWSARLYGRLDPENTLEQHGMVTQTPTAPTDTTGSTPSAVTAAPDPSSSTPAPGAAPGRTHVIQNGETLSTIAAAVYGSPNYYPYLLRANPTLNPNRLKLGAVINIPDIAEVHPANNLAGPTTGPSTRPMAVQAAEVVVDPTREYVVESGDSLHKIAIKLYGKVAMVDKIYELNKEAIGPDKARLKLHMVLKLPQPPVAVPATQQ